MRIRSSSADWKRAEVSGRLVAVAGRTGTHPVHLIDEPFGRRGDLPAGRRSSEEHRMAMSKYSVTAMMCALLGVASVGCGGESSPDSAADAGTADADESERQAECCPSYGAPTSGSDCSEECGGVECEYGYDPVRCGGVTYSCLEETWEHTGSAPMNPDCTADAE